jgi:hypothetical protein
MSDIALTLSLVDQVTGPAKKAQGAFADLTAQAQKLSGGMTGFTDSAKGATTQAGSASSALGGLGSVVAGAGAAAVTAAAALTALVVAGAALALSMSEAKAKTLATLSAMAGGTAKGQQLYDSLDGLRSQLGLTTAELVPMTQGLMDLGITGDALKTQLTALASVKAIGGDQGAEEYNAILRKVQGNAKLTSKDLLGLSKTTVNGADVAKSMGISLDKLKEGLKSGAITSAQFGANLTKLVTAKGMGPLEQQANSFSAQVALLKENFLKLFDGIDAGPFLGAMKSLFSLFDQTTASGKTMKAGITGFFNGVFSIAAKVIPYIKIGIEKIIIAALQLYIKAKPVVAWLKEMWQQHDGLGKLELAFKGIAAVIALVAVGAAVMIAPFVIALAAITAVAVGVGLLLSKLADFATDAVKALAGFASSGASLAADFVSGLVAGIANGASAAIAAVQKLGGSLMSAAKGALSAVFGGGGGGGGGADPGGVQAHANAKGGLVKPANGELLASVAPGETIVPAGATMAQKPNAGPAAAGPSPAGGGGGGGGGGIKMTNNITITVSGGGGGGGDQQKAAEETGELFAEQMSIVLEQIAMSQGMGMNA